MSTKKILAVLLALFVLELQYPAVGTAGAVLQTVNLEAARHLKTAPLLRIQPLQTAKFQPFP